MSRTVFKNGDLVRHWLRGSIPNGRNHSGVFKFNEGFLYNHPKYSNEPNLVARVIKNKERNESIVIFAYGFTWWTLPYAKTRIVMEEINKLGLKYFSLEKEEHIGKATLDIASLVDTFAKRMKEYVKTYYRDNGNWVGYKAYWFNQLKEAWANAVYLNNFFDLGMDISIPIMSQDEFDTLNLVYTLEKQNA